MEAINVALLATLCALAAAVCVLLWMNIVSIEHARNAAAKGERELLAGLNALRRAVEAMLRERKGRG